MRVARMRRASAELRAYAGRSGPRCVRRRVGHLGQHRPPGEEPHPQSTATLGQHWRRSPQGGDVEKARWDRQVALEILGRTSMVLTTPHLCEGQGVAMGGQQCLAVGLHPEGFSGGSPGGRRCGGRARRVSPHLVAQHCAEAGGEGAQRDARKAGCQIGASVSTRLRRGVKYAREHCPHYRPGAQRASVRAMDIGIVLFDIKAAFSSLGWGSICGSRRDAHPDVADHSPARPERGPHCSHRFRGRRYRFIL